MNSPFKFLDSYTKEDKDIFFGRDKEIEELYSKVFESKLILVYGASGTGKSSLINCGLANKFEDSDWLPVSVRRGENVLQSLKSSIESIAITRVKPKTSIKKSITSLYLDHFKPIYLIFDQFEELFIFGDDEEKIGLINEISDIVNEEIQCKFIFIIREEYLANLTDYEIVIPSFFENRIRIERMTRTNAGECIAGPCKVHGITIEKGFEENLLKKLSPEKSEIELTYLQVFLDKLYRKSLERNSGNGQSTEFTNAMLGDIGRVGDILSEFLEEQISNLKDSEAGLTVLKGFVSLQGTKRQIGIDEIEEFTKTLGKEIPSETIESNIHQFVDLRILKDKDENGKYELRHDSLARKIYEKITVIEKELLEVRQFLTNSYNEYDKRGILLREDDLNYIAPYKNKLLLNRSIIGFINESQKAIDSRKKRKRRGVIFLMSGLIVVLSAFAYFNFQERKKAEEMQQIAEDLAKEAQMSKNNADIASNAASKAQANAEVSKKDAFLALDEANIANIQAREAESRALHLKGIAELKGQFALDQQKQAIKSKEEALEQKKIAESERNRALGLHKLSQAGQLATVALFNEKIDPMVRFRLAEAAYNLDPSILAIEALYDAYNKPNFHQTIRGHTKWLNDVSFSSDGKYILSASGDNTSRLWTSEGKELLILNHNKRVESATFSNDDKYLLTASWDSTVVVWNWEGNKIITLKHNGKVNDANFSPDNSQIVTASSDNIATIWDIKGNKIREIVGHTADVISSQFSNDGTRILTCSYDVTIRIWDLEGNQIKKMKSGYDLGRSAAYANKSDKITAASLSNQAFVINSNGNFETRFDEVSAQVYSSEFSPDDKLIVTGTSDGMVKIWDVNGELLNTFLGHSGGVRAAKFSSDGKKVISAGGDNTIRIWNVNENSSVIINEGKSIRRIVIADDGKHLLTASGSYTKGQSIHVWGINGKLVSKIKENNPVVDLLKFLPNNQIITSSSQINSSGGRMYRLKGAKGKKVKHINKPSFSQGYININNLNGDKIQTIKDHDKSVTKFAFSGDKKYMISSSRDKTIRIWDSNWIQQAIVNHDYQRILAVEFMSDDQEFCLVSRAGRVITIKNLEGGTFQTQTDEGGAPIIALYIAYYNLKGDFLRKQTIELEYIPRSVELSPDKTFWVVNQAHGNFSAFDMNGNRTGLFPGEYEEYFDMKISPNSKFVLTFGLHDNFVSVWSRDGDLLMELRGHTEQIRDVGISPDSKFIVTGSVDNTVRVWNMEGIELYVYKQHQDEIDIVQFTKDGNYIVSASGDNEIHVWPSRPEVILKLVNEDKIRGIIPKLTEEQLVKYGLN
ncbi:MAG: hypothetical protein COC01_07695 [Bacteroidetes bacterium]|nr:hypothetical protein [Bacteroidia bacterium]PCH66595.1 MAG: hypothetical protein COC01_07695 [Bacteroidota bacterium]